jgi:hypothetical protein
MSMSIPKIEPMGDTQLAQLPPDVQKHIRALEEQNAALEQATGLLMQMDVFPDIRVTLDEIAMKLRDSQKERVNRQGSEPISVNLEDHQGIYRHPDTKALVGLTLELSGDRINVFTDKEDPDARSFAIELQDDALRVLAYNALSESPAVLTLPEREEIGLDNEDYCQNRYEDDSPTP